jgi:hypothetical protein
LYSRQPATGSKGDATGSGLLGVCLQFALHWKGHLGYLMEVAAFVELPGEPSPGLLLCGPQALGQLSHDFQSHCEVRLAVSCPDDVLIISAAGHMPRLTAKGVVRRRLQMTSVSGQPPITLLVCLPRCCLPKWCIYLLCPLELNGNSPSLQSLFCVTQQIDKDLSSSCWL